MHIGRNTWHTKKIGVSTWARVFRHAEFEVLLILIFKIHSPSEVSLDWMNYSHAHLDFRRRGWVKNAACPVLMAPKNLAPLKDNSLYIHTK